MDSETLQILLSRFDKTDSKIDALKDEQASLRADVAVLQDRAADAKWNQRARYAITFAIGALGGWLGIHIPGAHK